MNLNGKIAFITGSSSGIGAACALRFVEAGAIVAGLEREKQQARKRIAEPLHRLATPNGRAQLQQLLNEQ